MAAVRARRAAGRHHPRLLLLACLRLGTAVALSSLSVRRPIDLRRPRQFSETLRRPRVPAERDDQRRLLVHRDLRGTRAGLAARLARQREDSRARGLPLALAVAVRYRARHRRHSLAFHLPSLLRHPALPPVIRDHVPVQLVSQGLGRPGAHHRGRDMEAIRLQFGVLPRRASGGRDVGPGGGERRRRGSYSAFLRDHVPASLPGDVLPLHAQHDVLIFRYLWHRPRGDPGGARRCHFAPRLQGVEGRVRRAAARTVGGAVRRPHGRGDRPHRFPVPLRGEEGDVLMDRVLAETGVLAIEAPMRRRRRDWSGVLAHAILIVAVAVLAFPLYYALVISTQTVAQTTTLPPTLLPSTRALDNYMTAWRKAAMARLLLNSAVMALSVAIGKIVISMLSAFAIVYFNFRGKQLVFWTIFITLMLPVPVRIVSTYEVISTLGWVNTYWGLSVPLMASATGTFLFRQFFQTIPDSLAEAAQLDGAGPIRFLWSILLPLSKANMAALFVILFVYGWNEYLWPLMVTTTGDMRTAVVGLEALVPRGGSELPEWNVIMAAAMMVLLPPVAVIIFMQRWFVKGLVETEK